MAQRWLPHDVAWRPKSDFLAPFDTLFLQDGPPWVNELLSEASLRRTGYFDPAAILVGSPSSSTKAPSSRPDGT